MTPTKFVVNFRTIVVVHTAFKHSAERPGASRCQLKEPLDTPQSHLEGNVYTCTELCAGP